MKYCLSITLILASVLSLHTAPREPNRQYIEATSKKRRNRGIVEQTAATLCTATSTRSLSTKNIEIVVGGSISMPSEGEAEGQGTGFSYIANAETATIVISFDDAIPSSVTATAHDLDETRTVVVTDQTESSVTLRIVGFTPGNPTIVEFKTIQSKKA